MIRALLALALALALLAAPALAQSTGGGGGSGGAGCTLANPTASVGTAAVNGSASTCMRSDGAPAVDQTMSPTWTGTHTFTNSKIKLLGSSTGATTLTSGNAGASNFTMTIPGVSDTLAVLGTAQSFTAAQTNSATGNIFSGNGALSTPAIKLTGTWITGGDATTTKPYALIETAGATTNAWSTSGTGLGINAASGFTGVLADFQTNGASRMQVRANGVLVETNNIFTTATGCFGWGDPLSSQRSLVCSPADKSVLFEDSTTSNTFTFSLPVAAASATLQLGALDAAAPVAQTLLAQGVVAGTSNTAGVDLTIKGSPGTGTGLGGKIILQTAPAGGSGTAQNAQQTTLTLDAKSHAKWSSAAIPTVASCGTGSPTVTAGSTDNAGEVTVGTSATACTVSFKIAFTAAPFCSVTDLTTTARLLTAPVTTTAITMTLTSNSGDKIDWVCFGN